MLTKIKVKKKMTKLNNMPTEHDKWAKLKKGKNHKERVVQSLNRFQYRYRLACSFSSMTIDGTKPLTEKGYTAFMKLFLAYSAYDEVRAAEMILLNRETLRVHSIKNEIELAEKLRKNLKLKDLLIEGIESVNKDENDGLKKSLLNFYDANGRDILCVATAARNSFVHGDLTAGGAGLSINAKVTAIEELATVLRNYCDKLFSKCLKKIEVL
jgi:hypothetical protein